MRILVVSKYFPENLSTKVHGVHKRFRMFLDAIKDIAEIDLLYYRTQWNGHFPIFSYAVRTLFFSLF